jgi:hypothetical protein
MEVIVADDYRPDKFASDYNTPTGQKLWKLLNREDVIARMETASDLDQPALKAVEDILLAEFGDTILPDRIKQMTGHMVRQIMEARGFVHDTGDIKLASVPFYKASRYRRADRTSLYLFRSSKDPREIVLSNSRSVENLPAAPDKARWMFVNTISSGIKAMVGYNFDLKHAAKVVADKGFFRHRIARALRAG